MSKKIPYPADFERFWGKLSREFGALGSKFKAWRAFGTKNRPPTPELIEIYESQLRAKFLARRNNQFTANFPHIERWLRDRRWEDESETVGPGCSVCGDELVPGKEKCAWHLQYEGIAEEK